MTTGTCTSACRGPRTALRHNPRAHKVIIAAAGTAQRRAVGTHLRTFDLSIHYNLNVVFLLCCQGHPGQLPKAGAALPIGATAGKSFQHPLPIANTCAYRSIALAIAMGYNICPLPFDELLISR